MALSFPKKPERFREDVIFIFIKCNTKLPPYLPLPRFILRSELSLNAKLLYGLLLSRSMVSRKNDWTDDQGHVYIIYTIRQLAEDLDRSERTVKNALGELEAQDLIHRVRQGWNQPNHIYVLLPNRVQISSPPEGTICPVDGQNASPSMGQDLPPNDTNTKYTTNRKTKGEDLAPLGSYQNVFLSAEQLNELRQEFPDRLDAYIEKLSVYMKQHGKAYADHAVPLRKWLHEDQNTGAAYDYDYAYEEGECL